MPRRIQTSAVAFRTKTVAVMGDSIAFNATLHLLPHEYWPELLAVSLRALGCKVKARNFGKSGDTSTQMVTRFPNMTLYDTPTVGLIAAGINDANNGISNATTQANISSMITTLKAAGTTRIIVVAAHYYNFSVAYTAGTQRDTLATPHVVNAALRVVQAAAAAAQAVVFCDLYTYMRNLIVAGTYAEGDFGWHYADGNVHLNAAGERIVRDAVLATVQAQSGWVDALK